MKKIFFILLLVACVSVIWERNASAVMVYSENPRGGLTNVNDAAFYIFNNTAATISSGGNFSQTLPSAQAYSAATNMDIDLLDRYIGDGTETFTIHDPSGTTYAFSLVAYSDNHRNAWCEWWLTNGGDSSWNQTNGAQSPSGVYTIIEEGGPIEQIWNDKYIVTIMSNPQDENKDPPYSGTPFWHVAWVVITITPNTTSTNFFQSGIPNAGGSEWFDWVPN